MSGAFTSSLGLDAACRLLGCKVATENLGHMPIESLDHCGCQTPPYRHLIPSNCADLVSHYVIGLGSSRADAISETSLVCSPGRMMPSHL